MEMYRFLVDDLIISFCKDMTAKSFQFRTESHSGKVGKRQYLKKELEREFTDRLNQLFISTVEVPRVKVGRRQEVESLISEEAMLLAKFVRNEIKEWKPRIPELS